MHIQTDRALVAAETPAIRYYTVTITAPKPARAGDRPSRPAARVAIHTEIIIRDSIGAKSKCLNDFQTDLDEDGLHIRLGDLSEGQEVALVLATEISPKAQGASTSIVLRLADRDRVLYGAPMDVGWAALTWPNGADLAPEFLHDNVR